MPRVEWLTADPVGDYQAIVRQEFAPPIYFLRDPALHNRPVCDFCSYEGRQVFLVEGEIYATLCGFIIKSVTIARSTDGDWLLCRGCQARCRIKEGDSWVPLEVVKRVWLGRQRPIHRYWLRKLDLPADLIADERFSFMEMDNAPNN